VSPARTHQVSSDLYQAPPTRDSLSLPRIGAARPVPRYFQLPAMKIKANDDTCDAVDRIDSKQTTPTLRPAEQRLTIDLVTVVPKSPAAPRRMGCLSSSSSCGCLRGACMTASSRWLCVAWQSSLPSWWGSADGRSLDNIAWYNTSTPMGISALPSFECAQLELLGIAEPFFPPSRRTKRPGGSSSFGSGLVGNIEIVSFDHWQSD
jgi:hypothetical protein